MFWKLRKRVVTNKTENTYDTITETGDRLEDPEETRQYIADFYENLYQAREGTLEYQKWTDDINNRVKELDQQSIHAPAPERVTINELNKTIKLLKQNKATGPDKIPNEIFSKASNTTKQIYLENINKILETHNIPNSWQEGEIIRLYKGKGTKGKCSNERGITLANNFGKVFERIINNRITPKIHMTEAQAGGQKGRATVDHLLRLKDTVKKIKQNGKPAYIAFLDVTKAYDKAWLDAILYVMHKEGTDIGTWKIIKELNSNLKATLKTKYGNTRKITIKDSIRQGGVLSVIQYALLMDEINKEIIKQNIGPKMDNIQEPVGCLLWMDDVALISNNQTELQKLLDITHEIASRYHIEFGSAKSKILKIGKGKAKPDFYLGGKKLEYENTYKYLGETLNNKGNLENHINEIRRKTEAAYQTILTIMGNQHFNKIELETAWKLLETCIQPTYGGETWNLNKKEKRKINQIQENIIRRILMVPQSTPKTTLYMETGLLDATTIATKNRINMEKRLRKNPDSLTTKIMEANTPGGWKEITKDIKNKIQQNDNTIHTHQIIKQFHTMITKEAEGKRRANSY